MPFSSSVVNGSSMPLDAKSKLSASASSDSASISSGSLEMVAILSSASALVAPATGMRMLQMEIWSGSRPRRAASPLTAW